LNKFELIADAVSNPVIITSTNGRTLHINEGAKRLLDISGISECENISELGEGFNIDIKSEFSDFDTTLSNLKYSVSALSVTAEDGEPFRLFIFEDSVVCSRLVSEILEAIDEGVSVIDVDGRLETFNDIALKYVGMSISGRNDYIGENLQQALRENDFDYVLSQGVSQADAGADILDVNVGVPGLDEAALMQKCVKGLQATTDMPLQIDSGDVSALEAGLRAFCGKAIVNSVNGEQEKLNMVLPLVKKYGAAVVGLTMDEHGIPETAEERFEIAKRILTACESYGIAKQDVFIDCLCLTVSASQSSALQTLKAVRMVKEKLGLHTVLGVSNISFGLPNRELINSAFLTLAMENGLDLPIINPNVTAMTDAVAAFKLLKGFDNGALSYVEKYSSIMSTAPSTPSVSVDIFEAIAKGLKAESKALTLNLLETKTELEIINELLIPALDAVGERYEKGEIFLPQLMRSADASCEAFEVLKTNILKSGVSSVSKGKIVIATVKGDIHDIGKNIVKTILSNYGYQMIDLGRDVSPEAVVEAVHRENAQLIGLSALMTTTLPAMAETVKALRASGHECKIMVGGAVLTAEYAKEIGADYYARDAKRAVDIAKEVLG